MPFKSWVGQAGFFGRALGHFSESNGKAEHWGFRNNGPRMALVPHIPAAAGVHGLLFEQCSGGLTAVTFRLV